MIQNKIIHPYFLITFFLIVSLNFNFIFAQISPGDLTTAHEKYEGLSNCTKCHILGEKVHNSKCLDCHTEIKTLISSGGGYHSSSEVKGKNCSSCHSEHHGRNFEIVNFIPKKFDHSKTGFLLTGKHIDIDCSDCHLNKFIKDKKLLGRKNSYLGLHTACISCHEDYHAGALGKQCSSCHSTFSFKEAEKLYHDDTDFMLTGAHLNLNCTKCHQKEIKDGEVFQKFKALPFSGCVPCHKDVHAGKFGNDCQSCHETGSFRKIKLQAFDHNKTEFPLIGKHKNVECTECHKSEQVVGMNLKYGKCNDCHEDYHKGEFTKDEKVRDCSECHNEFGFKSSLFSIEDHAQTNFRLTGSHLAVSCTNCHYKNSVWQFKIDNTNCSGCHENIHGKEIKAARMTNDCITCHFTDKWTAIKYDHNLTEFKLLGKHTGLNCNNCHLIQENSSRQLLFASIDSNCEFCHKDIHISQFREEEETDCSRCHSFGNWEATEFNHDETLFPLKGAHRKTACSGCHKRIEGPGITYTNYKIKDFKCVSCHS